MCEPLAMTPTDEAMIRGMVDRGELKVAGATLLAELDATRAKLAEAQANYDTEFARHMRAADALTAAQATIKALTAACEAHHAWAWAEDHHLSATFNERMELCQYANWLTAKALAVVAGDPSGETYAGVKHLVIWPNTYIRQANEDEARGIVEPLIAEWRSSLASRPSDASNGGTP